MTTQNSEKNSFKEEENHQDLLDNFAVSILDGDFDEFKKLADEVLEKVGHFESKTQKQTSLLWICSYLAPKCIEMARYLLEKGANPNVVGDFGHTPLHACITYNRGREIQKTQEMIELLVEFGAHLETKNELGNLPQHFAKDLEIIKTLSTYHINFNAKGENGNTLLHFSSMNDGFEESVFLLEKGLDVNCRDDGGNTPVHLAAWYGNLDQIKLFVEHRADIHLPGKEMKTPLFHAFKRGNFEVFQFLLECGASIVALDENGEDLFSKQHSLSPQIQALYEQKKLEMNIPQNSHPKKTKMPRL